MSQFVTVISEAEFPQSGKLDIEVEDRFLLICKVEGQYYCIDDVCTHDGGPLGDGPFDGTCVECPRHGARFDVKTGAALCMPATEPTKTHQVRIVDGEIQVRVDSE